MTDTEFLALLRSADPALLLAFGRLCYARGALDAGGTETCPPMEPQLAAYVATIGMAEAARRAEDHRPPPDWLRAAWGPEAGPASEGWGG